MVNKVAKIDFFKNKIQEETKSTFISITTPDETKMIKWSKIMFEFGLTFSESVDTLETPFLEIKPIKLFVSMKTCTMVSIKV